MDDYWLCTQCLASNRAAASRSANCGSRVTQTDPARLCPSCGVGASGGFCPNCGRRLASRGGAAVRNLALLLALGLVIVLGATAGVVALQRLPPAPPAAAPAATGAVPVTAGDAQPTEPAPSTSPRPTAPPRTPRPAPSPTASPDARPTATPAADPTAQPTASPTTSPDRRPVATKPRSRQCRDKTYKLYPDRWRWTEPLEWRFNTASVPDDLDADDVLAVVQDSFENVTEARNECGREDNVDATASYLGTTERPACGPHADGHSVVAFGPLPAGSDRDTIAVTCTYAVGTRMVEADIVINEEEFWALSAKRCRGDQLLLEATVTHEVGHAFGLDHVGQRKHGHLTMSPKVAACDNGPATLGLGDLLGLEELYGEDDE